MDVHNRGALTWKELVLGLAAMEPGTQHGGTPGELRCRHIFRLYDGNCDGVMEYAEFRWGPSKVYVRGVAHLELHFIAPQPTTLPHWVIGTPKDDSRSKKCVLDGLWPTFL